MNQDNGTKSNGNKKNTKINIGETVSLMTAIGRLAKSMIDFRTDFRLVTNSFIKRLADEFRAAALADRVNSTGWLPHETTPFSQIATDDTPEEIDRKLSAYYSENWPAVREVFATRLEKYDLDDEAKNTFREAMDAHEAGLYRCSVRVLFPEIERIAREDIYDGKYYEPAKEDDPDDKRPSITNLTGLRDTVGGMPLHIVGSVDYGMALYDRMMQHLYKNVGTTKSKIERYRNDPVPNRHASLHGIVPYKSAKNSINMLVMADFMFHIISGMKKYISDAESTS